LDVSRRGFGGIDLPIAKPVVGAGCQAYRTFHIRREQAEELHAMGTAVVPTPQDVAKEANVVITIPLADAELRE